MSRSKWKTLPKQPRILDNKTQQRNIIILDQYINQTIEVYNGHKYIKVTITKDMVGHKLGEYALTRKRNIIKKK